MNNFCSNCGNQVTENDFVCSRCGAKVRNEVQNTQVVSSDDKGGFGWGVLGFFVPIAGLILYLVWKDDKPKTAKSAGIGALVSVAASIILPILFVLIGFLTYNAISY